MCPLDVSMKYIFLINQYRTIFDTLWTYKNYFEIRVSHQMSNITNSYLKITDLQYMDSKLTSCFAIWAYL